MGVVYKVENILNGKTYIGKTTKSLAERKTAHLCDARHSRGHYLHDAIRKYGEDNFLWDVLAEHGEEKILNSLEVKYIKYFNSADPSCGYNLTLGGDGQLGISPSPETRKKKSLSVSKSLKGHSVSEETRRKISDKLKGKKPTHMTEEFRNQLREKWLNDNPMYDEGLKAKAISAKGNR